jgi:hypothetical protein
MSDQAISTQSQSGQKDWDYMVKGVKYRRAVWLQDGAKAIIMWSRPTPERPQETCLHVTVACAAGNMARVVCEARGFDKWLSLRDIYVRSDSGMGG